MCPFPHPVCLQAEELHLLQSEVVKAEKSVKDIVYQLDLTRKTIDGLLADKAALRPKGDALLARFKVG